jgi:hypothetical protein
MKICGLCQNTVGVLRKTHLMPKALYKVIRNAYPDQGTDVKVYGIDNEKVTNINQQVWRHFLCPDCEQRFHKNGEDLVLRECWKREGGFVLLDKMKNAIPTQYYHTRKIAHPMLNSSFSVSDYLYFAASIIWRYSAGKWTDRMERLKLSLGPKYQEQVRQYLLGKSKFPDNIYILVYVNTYDDFNRIMIFPSSEKNSGYHLHMFFIPGVRFDIFVGSVLDELKQDFQAYNTKILFWESSFAKDSYIKQIADQRKKLSFKPESE